MLLIAGAIFSKKDVEAIKEGIDNAQDVIQKTMIKDLDNIEDEFVNDHVKALSWMIANKKLDIKIAIVNDDLGYPLDKNFVEQSGIFHQKIGIFEDKDGLKLSFSGSVNESAFAWKNNIEEFNVFREYVQDI